MPVLWAPFPEIVTFFWRASVPVVRVTAPTFCAKLMELLASFDTLTWATAQGRLPTSPAPPVPRVTVNEAGTVRSSSASSRGRARGGENGLWHVTFDLRRVPRSLERNMVQTPSVGET